MSIIYGELKSNGNVASTQELYDLAIATERCSPDGLFVRARGRVGMGFQPYHTHERSNLDFQPATDASNNMVVLDGRLDNYSVLCEQLHVEGESIPDSQIVLAAFNCWGEECFSRFVGDWAIALWSDSEQSLYLARDHAGARTLYFEQAGSAVRWSTRLGTFFSGGRSHTFDDRFAARYLACQPVCDLTPYTTIRSVPPAHYLKFHDYQLIQRSHWEWLAKEGIRYKSDSEYQEHFLWLFRQSVERRTGPGAPVLAELSGGVDSSAIVCMFDAITGSGGRDSAVLNTVSYYDDTEPTWNERPYFSIVEQQRGKSGFHIRTSFDQWSCAPLACPCPVYLPGLDSLTFDRERALAEVLRIQGSRVVLSGIGGDEVLGGIYHPTADLAELLFSRNVACVAQRALEWCLVERSPILHMIERLVAYLARLSWKPYPTLPRQPSWIHPRIGDHCRQRRHPCLPRWRPGLNPSRIENAITWWALLETLPHLPDHPSRRYEYRYPYLDRDLVDFLLRIPRGQLVRPGERRSLMRRSLKGVVPVAILEHRRKAFITRGPLAALRRESGALRGLFNDPVTAKMGYVLQPAIRAAFDSISASHDAQSLPTLMRAVSLELWLRMRTMSNEPRFSCESEVSH